jgi:biopolymer transport protein ExbD
MFRFQEENQTIDRMETAPFADIVFLLLIFFLLSSSFILPTGIPVNPPKSDSSVTMREQPVVVTITRDDVIHLDDKVVAAPDLATALGVRLATSPTKAVVGRGDQAVSLGRVVEVMNAARKAGAEKLAIATEPKTPAHR